MRGSVGWCRFVLGWFVAGAVIFGSAPAASQSAPCWRPPVMGVIVDAYREPACVWCPGNRGIEYSVADDTPVRSVATGTVAFSDVVAGIRYVVVRLPNGWRLTYGRLGTAEVELGDVIVVGSVVGTASGEFMFGLRIGDDYADPAPWLGSVVGRARLIPVDGSPARPAPPSQLRCRVGGSAR